jgi:hypothetical protein
VALALLAGCGTTRIFYASFESDTVGSLPAENPPGPPDGDLIWTSVGNMPAALSVVGSGELATKSLRYANINIPAYQRFVGFFSRPVSLAPDKTFYAYWSGRIYDDPAGSPLHVYLGNAHFLPMALLEFHNGTVRVQTSGGSSPQFETIGTYTSGVQHFVVITVDKAARTYRVSILQRPVSISTGPRPVLNDSALGTNRPTLYLFYSQDGASGSGRYFVDDVTLSEREPEMRE